MLQDMALDASWPVTYVVAEPSTTSTQSWDEALAYALAAEEVRRSPSPPASTSRPPSAQEGDHELALWLHDQEVQQLCKQHSGEPPAELYAPGPLRLSICRARPPPLAGQHLWPPPPLQPSSPCCQACSQRQRLSGP